MSDVTVFECPNCVGPIKFKKDSETEKCPYCETEFKLEDLKDALILEKK